MKPKDAPIDFIKGPRVVRQADITAAEVSTTHHVQAVARVPADTTQSQFVVTVMIRMIRMEYVHVGSVSLNWKSVEKR